MNRIPFAISIILIIVFSASCRVKPIYKKQAGNYCLTDSARYYNKFVEALIIDSLLTDLDSTYVLNTIYTPKSTKGACYTEIEKMAFLNDELKLAIKKMSVIEEEFIYKVPKDVVFKVAEYGFLHNQKRNPELDYTVLYLTEPTHVKSNYWITSYAILNKYLQGVILFSIIEIRSNDVKIIDTRMCGYGG